MASVSPSMALLVCDLSNAIVERIAAAERPAVMANAAAAIAAARAAGIRVIFVRVADISAAVPGNISPAQHDAAMQIHAQVAPLPQEQHVIKRRTGSFAGSDLAAALGAAGATHAVLVGLSLSGVVLAAHLSADLQLTFLADACADMDVTAEKRFPQRAATMNTADWVATL